MWAQAAATDASNNDDTICRATMLQWEFSLRLQPENAPLRDVFDALRLNADCGVSVPPGSTAGDVRIPRGTANVTTCDVGPFYVDPVNGNDSAAGTLAAPFKTIARGVDATRGRAAGTNACVVLRAGTHFLSATIALDAGDSGLSISGYTGEAAWVSGGVPLGALTWTPFDTSNSMNVWVADIPASIPITAMPGLNTLDGPVPTRLWRAKYPDYDQEQFSGDLPDDRDVVTWVKPPIMPIPELFYKDLKAMGLKNDSTVRKCSRAHAGLLRPPTGTRISPLCFDPLKSEQMREYNIYATGRGGPCDHWANDGDEWAYVCSNSTAGGWEEIERGLASTGQLGFPVAMIYNQSRLPARLAKWTTPTSDSFDWTNSPTITVWHNQGWYQATYSITGIDGNAGVLNMSADGIWPAGGWQGGRTMENRDPDNLTVSQPMGSGPWYVSNVREELTVAGEFWFDPTARKLYAFYNASAGTPPPASWLLSSSQLEVFFNLSGTPAEPVTDVTFNGLGFRDQRNAQLFPWIDPSGGDWGLRRAGLLHLEGTERVTVSDNVFYRTDSNAVFLAAYNRNATVIGNEFAYVGFSALVTFGRTNQDDGTGGEQPWGTVFAYNKVHEIGTYQLQSSAWFTSKAALTRAEGNIVFNIPRAAINLNDGFGGGNNITLSSIFNTCSAFKTGPRCALARMIPDPNTLPYSASTTNSRPPERAIW